LETAQRLFNEAGVETVSMTAIAQAAGVGKGTLYRHFENKAILCQALLDHDQLELQTHTLMRLRKYPDQPLDNLRWFLVEVAHFVHRNRVMLSAVSDSSPQSYLEHAAHLWWRQTIRKLLQQI